MDILFKRKMPSGAVAHHIGYRMDERGERNDRCGIDSVQGGIDARGCYSMEVIERTHATQCNNNSPFNSSGFFACVLYNGSNQHFFTGWFLFVVVCR